MIGLIIGGAVLLVAIVVGVALLFVLGRTEQQAAPVVIVNPPGGDVGPNFGPKGPMQQQKPADEIVQASVQRIRLDVGIKDTDLKAVALNSPSNTRAAVYYWKNVGGKLGHVVDFYDLPKNEKLTHVEVPQPQQIDLAPDGSRLAVFSQVVEKGKLAKQVSIWAMPAKAIVLQNWSPYPEQKEFGKRRDLIWVYLLDADRILTVAQQGQLDLWEIETKKLLFSVPPSAEGLNLTANGFGLTTNSFCISPDRKTVAILNKAGFSLFDTATGKPAGKTAPLIIEPGTFQNIWGVSFSPDGKSLAANFFFALKQDNQQLAMLAHWSAPDGKLLNSTIIKQDLGAGGGLSFWGSKHVALWDGNLYEPKIHDLATGSFCRACKVRGFGRGVGQPQDGKMWFATSDVPLGSASIAAVEFPLSDLGRFPPRPDGPRRWFLLPAGVTPTPGQ